MLAIRMQRTGRKGHANFRIVVQDSRKSPASGKVVASIGSYDPHAKTSVLDKEKATHFLSNGAQPSERVALLLKKEGVTLPAWVSINTKKAKTLRNPEKLRRNRPAEEKKTEVLKEEVPAVEAETPVETPAEEVTPEVAETAAEEKPTEEPADETEQPAENAV